jgi:hypothetical protein
MSPDLEPPSDEQIVSAMVEARLVAPADEVRLQRHTPNLNRRDGHRRIACRVRVRGRIGFHLTAGTALERLRRRTEAFANAHPEIACKSVFFVHARGLDLFGQEDFGEGNLEEGWGQKKIDDRVWRAGVTAIKERLRSGSQPSSPSGALEEIDALEQRLLALDRPAHIDPMLLRSELFPMIREGAAGAPRRATWTNGDFIARNILFDGTGGFRLIDHEFAGPTHFEEIDWFRLERFSSVPPTVSVAGLSGMARRPVWLDVLCWLQHALMLSEVCVPEAVERDFRTIASHLTRLLRSKSSPVK